MRLAPAGLAVDKGGWHHLDQKPQHAHLWRHTTSAPSGLTKMMRQQRTAWTGDVQGGRTEQVLNLDQFTSVLG
jgi:hypothetical protein